MASAPEGTDPLNYQTTSVLKVSIHCEGCKKKVRKVLQGLEGVYSVDVNSKENKVTVTSSIDAESLIRRLVKHGKHAERWPEKKPIAANSSDHAAGDANAKPKTEQQLPNTEQQKQQQQQQTEEGKTEATEAPEISDSKANTETDPPNCSESDKRDGEEADDLKEEKKAERETSSEDESAVSDADKFGNAAVAGETPPSPPPKKTPSSAHPLYTVSYSTVQPSSSYAYYASPPPTENCSFDQWYGSMEEVSGASYDMFNDENPNACILM